MYGSRFATITTRSPWRCRLSVFLSRCAVQSPPSPSVSRSEASRSTRSRTSRTKGTNSARGGAPLSSRRSSSPQLRHDRRAATTVTTDAASARKANAMQQEVPGRRLPAVDEAHVVDQHDEAQRPTVVDQRNGRGVDVPAGHADLGGPHRPVRHRGVGGRPDPGAGEPAAGLRRVVAGLGQQGHVGPARGRRHDALVAGDPQEDLVQRGRVARVPVGDQRLAGSRHGERGAQLDVPVEPVPGGPMDHERRSPREQRQPGHQDEDEPQRAHVESI